MKRGTGPLTAAAEEWRDVPDWPGYQVSGTGRVRSLNRMIQGPWGPRRIRGTELILQIGTNGRPYVSLCRAGEVKHGYVHVLVASAFLGPRPPGLFVLHGDDDVMNNAVGNLRYGTPLENNQDCVTRGRHPNMRKTHCPLDHPLTDGNLVAGSLRRGRRACLACNRARAYLRTYPGRDLKPVADRYYAEIAAAQPTGLAS